MHGAVDAVLSRLGVVAGVCVGDVGRDGPEHGDVMGEERRWCWVEYQSIYG